MTALSPSFMAREEDKTKFQELLGKTTDSTHFFTLFLKKEKAKVEIAVAARKVCEDIKKKEEEKKEEEKKEEEKKE